MAVPRVLVRVFDAVAVVVRFRGVVIVLVVVIAVTVLVRVCYSVEMGVFVRVSGIGWRVGHRGHFKALGWRPAQV